MGKQRTTGETIVDLMAHGVDSHRVVGRPANRPVDGARALADLMRRGPMPRRANAPVPPIERRVFRGSPIGSRLWWNLTQRLLAACAIVVLLPLAPLLWIGVKLSSPGPFLFRQRRRGREGYPFTIWKIRTLTTDAELNTMLGVDRLSPHVTRFGRILRQLKLDEVPQLWNVVAGDMELVGPRPIPIALEDRLREVIPGFRERNRVKPGLTSLAQVAIVDNRLGANLFDDWQERFEAELHYIRRKSFTYDAVVIGMSALFVARSLLRVVRGTPRPRPRAGVPTATEVIGVPVADLTRAQVLDRIATWIAAEQSRYIAFCPVHSLVEAARSASHRQSLLGAAICAADGVPVVWAQQMLGNRHAERVYGPDVMLDALARAERDGWRVAFYGGSPERLELLVARMRERFPKLDVCAWISPPFRPLTEEEDLATTRRLAAASPQLVLVGLGCPKQERWMAEHQGRVPGVLLGVGAAFDFHAGAVRQAPAVFQRLGLEWAFRLACEPRRLFRRYATTNPIFLLLFATQMSKHLVLRRRYRVELDTPRLPATAATARYERPEPDPESAEMLDAPPVAVCIATWRRPELLRATLHSLMALDLPDGAGRLEVRVVDNDAEGGARKVAEAFAEESPKWIWVRYACEPERSISLARNRALDLGPARRIAFIDDDEVADRNWLKVLWNTLEDERVDAAFGRVDAVLPPDAPQWLRRGAFLDKPAGPEGISLGWESTRTSSALVDGSWFYQHAFRFDPRFGRSGGEDTDLFRRIAAAGGRFRAAPESAVSEVVLPEQCRLRWFLERFWRGGANYERLVAPSEPRMRPLGRFVKRIAINLPLAVSSLPAAIRGRPESLYGALMNLARAGGGLLGWLWPARYENSKGYQSRGATPLRTRREEGPPR